MKALQGACGAAFAALLPPPGAAAAAAMTASYTSLFLGSELCHAAV